MHIYIGADHAGFKYKVNLISDLQKLGHTLHDVGGQGIAHDDYVDYAQRVAKFVVQSPARKGILICGTGTGMAMAANRIKGARAALCYDLYTAKKSKEDNNANILTLRARGTQYATVLSITKTWLKTPFSNKARHKRRVQKIEDTQ